MLVLLAVATACALVFHVAPACFAARYTTLGSRISWAFVPVAIGYIIYSTRLLLATVKQLLNFTPSQITLAVPLLLLMALASVRWSWKPATALALLTGVAISIYMLATPWHGIWAVHSNFAQEPPEESEYLVEGLFLAIAPAFAIAWRIGSLVSRKSHIWLSAAAAFFFPLCLSVSVTALMAQAGENLFWRPSLFLSFYWALVGPDGGNNAITGRVISIALALSLLGPAFVAVLSVRLLALGFTTAKKVTLTIGAAVVIAWLMITQPNVSFYPPYDPTLRLWTALLAILGIAVGLVCLLRRPAQRSA
jgi:hypothetical protein